MKLVVLCVVVLTLGMAGAAEAQFCAGAPSFRDGPMQVGFGASFGDGVRGVGGTFAGGGESIFGGIGLSVINFTAIDELATTVSAFGGAELQADDAGRVFLCPVAAAGFGAGPDIGPIDVSTVSLRGGGSLGVIASDQSGLMVIPHFGLFAVYSRVTADFGEDDESIGDTSGLATVGVGFVFNRNVGIIPSLSIPFSGAADPDVLFTLQFAFNFGR